MNVIITVPAMALSVLVTVLRRVDLPTDGKPMRATRASPDFITSKPSPLPPDLDGSNNCALYLASFAFNKPKWCSVAANQNRDYIKEI